MRKIISVCLAGTVLCGCAVSNRFIGARLVVVSMEERKMTVDADPTDWVEIAPNVVKGQANLWFGQGMTPEKWQGNQDLSYQWRGAWSGNKLFFLVEVTDDRVLNPTQQASYLSDCVEIYLDYAHRRGPRVKILDGRKEWVSKCDPKELLGYELHFLPGPPPVVFLDHRARYTIDKPHTEEFSKDWTGEVASRKTPTGYIIEVGLTIPSVELKKGKVIGVEVGVCDDDGEGRKSIMMWTGTKNDFWLDMSEYGRVTLSGQ